jgi:hypothetical protein
LCTNLLLGHVAINCHRIVTDAPSVTDGCDKEAVQEEREAVKDHIFCWRYVHVGSTTKCQNKEEFNTLESKSASASASRTVSTLKKERFQFTMLGKTVVTVLLVGCMFLVIAGVFLLSFVYHFKGLVGLLLGSAADTQYSVISTGTTVPSASGAPDSFIVRWIQVCFFGFGVVMPLFFLCVMLVVWVIPLRRGVHRSFVIVAEVANAWNAIDVFVVSG